MVQRHHLSEQALAEALGSDPGDPSKADTRDHLASCPDCRFRLERLSESGSAATVAPSADRERARPGADEFFERGTNLGRYVLLDLLGRGGMAQVYGAYDPELGRRVAVKLVRVPAGSVPGTLGDQSRLLREAQAMAQLAHPNVVAIYDVGTFHDRVFIAMELVEGGTLRDWLRESPRPWRETLARLMEAGRGLEAAHAAGLIHRDFKPENVLVGNDGRVRVTDFGLARAGGPASQEGPHLAGASFEESGLTGSLTVAGAVMGTPGYMSPEQLRGKPVDARSDQFSFFVALSEALDGALPFGTGSLPDLASRIESRAIHAPPRTTKIPRRVREVLRKGLEPQPDGRFPNMAAALEALARAARPRRAQWAGAGLAVAVVLAAVGYRAWERTHPQVSCAGLATQLNGKWDEPTRAAINAAFAATGLPYAHDAWVGAERTLDAWARNWLSERTDACQAERALPSGEVPREQRRCLDEQLSAFAGLVGQLQHADAKLVRVAPVTAGSLPRPRDCADARALRERARALGSDGSAAAAEIRGKLAEAKALSAAHQAKAALAVLGPLAAAARSADSRALLADVLGEQGALQAQIGDFKNAGVTLEEADLAAEASGLDWLRTRLALEQAHAAYIVNDVPTGRRWLSRARALLTRVGGDDSLEADWQINAAALSMVEGKLAESVQGMKEALALRRKLFGPEHPKVAEMLGNLAVVLEDSGHFEEGLADAREAASVQEKLFGPEHPLTAGSRVFVGRLLSDEGDSEAARAMVRAALPAMEREYGTEDRRLAEPYAVVGEASLALGDFPAAAAAFKRLEEILIRAFGPDSEPVATSRLEWAELKRVQGDLKGALELTRGSIAALEKASVRPDEEAIGMGLKGRIELDLGQPEAAAKDLERAVAALKDVGGAENLKRLPIESDLGEAYLALGRPQEALNLLEPVVKAARAHRLASMDRSRAIFALARAEAAAGDRERGQALAKEALGAVQSQAPQAQALTLSIQKWLAR